MTQLDRSLDDLAVSHAHDAERAADLSWKHLYSEYSQDIDQVLATLATDAPLAWTAPATDLLGAGGGGFRYLVGRDREEIRQQYVNLRQFVEIWDWKAILELRQSWYICTHGVVTVKMLETGETSQMETVTFFPVGRDGILGELQIGDIGLLRENRWPEVPTKPGEIPLPEKRLYALQLHDKYLEDLRTENVAGLIAAHRDDAIATIRNYVADESTLLNAEGAAAIGEYFEALFGKYRVRDIRFVNRVLDTWYVFAELHWLVEERATGRELEFCTAETSPIDPDGRFWVRTGAGTNPVEYGG
jgi:hypothetical protein